MYWEYTFFWSAVFAFMLIFSLIAAVIGVITALLRAGGSGFIRFFAKWAFAFAGLTVASILIPYCTFRQSLAGLVLYALCGVLGIAGFVFALFSALKNKLNNCLFENICGIISVLISCGSLSLVIYCSCLENGVLQENKLFDHECVKLLHLFFMFGLGMWFMPVFALFALITGGIREKCYGFFKNLLLLTVAPGGLTACGIMIYHRLDKIQSGRFAIYAFITVWLLCMTVPYGIMLWRGKRQKNEKKYCNGLAGCGAVICFLLLMGIAAYLGKYH